GLRPGDVILTINGQSTIDPRRTMTDIARVAPGTQIPVVVIRAGERLEVMLEVAERPTPAGLKARRKDADR
ncbi:MAG TPA: PDZ domain-containing protein, partial [Halomonas sp.]|nr:PDZ domain-containing protein [Halomonas sp.]